ncbi:hypothetical protein HHX47_DHR10000284 [Lentinula edodes]|nr:hypothetical protein HHX47_DHR10000284 [Lentinula edodes]
MSQFGINYKSPISSVVYPSVLISMASSASSAIARIRESVEDFSFTNGTCNVPHEFCHFYFKRQLESTEAKFLDTANATKEQLASWISVCEPAPFGQGTETFLDKSYRKALKLNLLQFATPFDLASTIILHSIQQDLVETDTALRRMIRAEPYKLNVYNESSFFKPHRDTPCGPNMLGSLVIIFRTTHEGGELILTENNKS